MNTEYHFIHTETVCNLCNQDVQFIIKRRQSSYAEEPPFHKKELIVHFVLPAFLSGNYNYFICRKQINNE
jgi:hypothetical protein